MRPADARLLVRLGLALETLDPSTVAHLDLIVSELVTNSWQVGADVVELACWRVPHGVAVHVDDDGPGFDDPLAGYRRPAPDAPRGRGLWMVRQLADVLEVSSTPSKTAVRALLFAGA